MADLFAGAAALGASSLVAAVCLIVYSLAFGDGPVSSAGVLVMTRMTTATITAFVVVAVIAAAASVTCPQLRAPACRFQISDLVPRLDV